MYCRAFLTTLKNYHIITLKIAPKNINIGGIVMSEWSKRFYIGVKWLNGFAALCLLMFTGYVVSGDTSAVSGWYGYFFAATGTLFILDFFSRRNSATEAMWVALVWFVVWMLWLFATTLAMLSLPHLQGMVHSFNGTLFVFLAVSIMNLINILPLFGKAIEERVGSWRPFFNNKKM